MKIKISFLLLFCSYALFAQRFEVVGSVYEGENIDVQGEVFVDVTNRTIEININGREMTLQKMTLKKGEKGELLCYKEGVETKQRIVFSPNKNRKGKLVRVTHIMRYTVVQGFSRNRSEVIYHLIKKRTK